MKFSALITSCFLLFTTIGCSGLFYYPDSNMYYRAENLEAKPVQYELKDRKGRKIIGWYFRNKKNQTPKAKILFYHGNAQNISSHFTSLYWILDYPYDFFIFDYPGYGGSEGSPDRDSVVESGYTAMKWLHEKDPQVPMAIFGQSLGGNISLYTTARYKKEFPVCQVTVDSTFLSYPKVAQTVLSTSVWTWPFQWLPYLLVGNYKSARENIAQISPTPLLVMHGDADVNVDILNGRQVFEKAKEPKEFWRVPGGMHIDAFNGKTKFEFRKRYLEKLEQSCKK